MNKINYILFIDFGRLGFQIFMSAPFFIIISGTYKFLGLIFHINFEFCLANCIDFHTWIFVYRIVVIKSCILCLALNMPKTSSEGQG